MTVDQLDELIRKYLSTGVAMVLVLVGPAAAPSGATAPQAATTSAHSTGAPPTNSRSPSRSDTDERIRRAGPTTPGPSPPPNPTPPASPPPTPGRSPPPNPTPTPRTTAGPAATPPPPPPPTAGASPTGADDFTGGLGWGVYDGPGHGGKGSRSPDAVERRRRRPHITGDAQGTTAGMAWGTDGQKYGRWEGRVRAPAGDPTYNALLLLWPDAEDCPVGRRDRLHGDDRPHPPVHRHLPPPRRGQRPGARDGEDRRHPVAQLGGRVDAEGHHRLRRRQAVVAHRQGRSPPARPHAPVHPARLVPAGAATARSGRRRCRSTGCANTRSTRRRRTSRSCATSSTHVRVVTAPLSRATVPGQYSARGVGVPHRCHTIG